jgi:hypothetical protein
VGASRFFVVAVAAASVALGCGSSAGNSPSTPPCDQQCTDAAALRSLRDSLKLAFNLGLQGKPVGAQDATVSCPLGGTAHVFGQATSNAQQGATMVDLTYDLAACALSSQDADPNRDYSMTVTGVVKESGTIAVQPTSTTALDLSSNGVTLSGTVYDPPIDYAASACALVAGQDGSRLSGTMCMRAVGVTL